MKYPNPCCRCGFCCLSTPCPIALEKVIGAEKGKPCPALEFQNDLSRCKLFVLYVEMKPKDEEYIKIAFGFDVGCCIKARCINSETGIQVDFASLPAETKKAIVAKRRK